MKAILNFPSDSVLKSAKLFALARRSHESGNIRRVIAMLPRMRAASSDVRRIHPDSPLASRLSDLMLWYSDGIECIFVNRGRYYSFDVVCANLDKAIDWVFRNALNG